MADTAEAARRTTELIEGQVVPALLRDRDGAGEHRAANGPSRCDTVRPSPENENGSTIHGQNDRRPSPDPNPPRTASRKARALAPSRAIGIRAVRGGHRTPIAAMAVDRAGPA